MARWQRSAKASYRLLHESALRPAKRKSTATFAPLPSFYDAPPADRPADGASPPHPREPLDPRPRGDPDPPSPPPAATPSPSPVDPFSAAEIPTGQPHHDLASFLVHAHRTSLRRTSSVYTGTLYEYLVRHTLARAHFSLKRIGGRDDLGIDLLGFLQPPLPILPPSVPGSGSGPIIAHPEPDPDPGSLEGPKIPVFAQCKFLGRSAKGPAPSMLRELEGAFQGLPASWRAGSLGRAGLGLLVSNQKASRGIIDGLGRSRLPLGFLMVETMPAREERLQLADPSPSPSPVADPDVEDGLRPDGGEGLARLTYPKTLLRQFIWNQAAVHEGGMDKLGVTWRYYDDPGAEDGKEQELVFCIGGYTIPPKAGTG